MYPQQARKIFSAVSRPAGRLLATRSSPAIRSLSTYGESITYSGGQASEGQGGYYGSGGARKSILETEHRPEMLALSSDVENLVALMDEIQKLEATLQDEIEKSGNSVGGKSLEIKSSIKKIMTSSDVMNCLNRLEVDGEPVWGLSSNERDLVHYARQKVNEC
mmetsp:Transcript_31716/g.75696  ORF Transcript_31716/g.75696 Transcript_31716/m.75696 type:complete len:163 (+) Transcript_31716:34-522(+)